jgi:hypothetical protein
VPTQDDAPSWARPQPLSQAFGAANEVDQIDLQLLVGTLVDETKDVGHVAAVLVEVGEDVASAFRVVEEGEGGKGLRAVLGEQVFDRGVRFASTEAAAAHGLGAGGVDGEAA